MVGNDAGEQLSILAGTLARLDREAPEYGFGKYNDFNTFYLQAASGTSGGSSGSPVIDIRGRVVGAQRRRRDRRRLELLSAARARAARAEVHPGRASRCRAARSYTVFNYTPYDELERLGLDAGTEARCASTSRSCTGMLVVTRCCRARRATTCCSPATSWCASTATTSTQFDPLEEVLDSSVGAAGRKLELERGGKPVRRQLPVGDLHAITPSDYIEFGEAVVHTLSYQQARQFNVPIKRAYSSPIPAMCSAPPAFRAARCISSFNGKTIDDLADFEAALGELGDGERATVRYVDPR